MCSAKLGVPLSIMMLVISVTAQAKVAPDSQLTGDARDLRELADGKIAALTSRAIYLADDRSLTRWTAVAVFPFERAVIPMRIVGGTSERIYMTLLTPETPKDVQMRAWSPSGGFETLARMTMLSRRCWSFVNDKLGFYGQDAGLIVTVDGGRTWRNLQQLIPELDIVDCAAWISDKQIVISSLHSGTIIGYNVDATGRLDRAWSRRYEDGVYDLTVERDNGIWLLHGSGTAAFLKTDGTPLAEVETARQDTSHIVSTNGGLCVVHDESVDLLKRADGKIASAGTLETGQVSSVLSVPEGVYGFVGIRKVLARLDTDNRRPKPLTLVVDNRLVKEADAKIAASRAADTATPEEIAEMGTLARQLTPEEQESVVRPIMAMPGRTNRERILLVIEGLKKAIAERQAATQPK